MPEALDALRARYARILQRLAPQRVASPFHGEVQLRPTHNGDAHVEWIDGQFHYVVTERGAELHRRVAQDEEELLYWLFDDTTAAMAYRTRPSWWTRLRGGDPRRYRFAMHEALLHKLDPAWAQRKRRHHADVLQRYPFR